MLQESTHGRCIYAKSFDKSSFSKLNFILNLYIFIKQL